MKSERPASGASGMRWLPALVIASLLAGACGNDERSYVANIGDGDHSPTMTTYQVETFISDSGYTRYHISTPVWKMFEEASEPFWRFPDGLNLQQYDLQMQPDATMECDSAVYFSRMRLWQLDGHVMMVNTLRDTFLSQQLFWDQAKRQVYTDSFIHIVRSDRIIEGYGFESNENMTAYTIHRPTAILPVQRGITSKENEAADTVAADTATVVSRRRGAARPLSSSQAEPTGQEEQTKQRATRIKFDKNARVRIKSSNDNN
ncbi:MAG: LPS export ABC transporter periplasmic protein LptC [Muribaculaceae bacterium]|nr:LPS export ABC transporter periplasmic protein LptC [Muribaculaceae bacterium]